LEHASSVIDAELVCFPASCRRRADKAGECGDVVNRRFWLAAAERAAKPADPAALETYSAALAAKIEHEQDSRAVVWDAEEQCLATPPVYAEGVQ
jgi:hypothetical protein